MPEEINSTTISTLLHHMSKTDYLELVEEFIHDTRRQLKAISNPKFSADPETVIRSVHSIKGNASSLGFDLLSHQSAEFEKALREDEIKANSVIFAKYNSQVHDSIKTLVDYFNIDDRRRL